MTSKQKQVALVVTTAHRGVFFGYGVVSDAPTIRLERARMCVYWSANVQGVLGLAASGPMDGCKISSEIPAITLRDVTSVMEASEAAEKQWVAAKWS